jgi:hypothetical protein
VSGSPKRHRGTIEESRKTKETAARLANGECPEERITFESSQG